jgi:prefoldin subunit 5
MDSAILCAIISGAVTLIVSIGTWHVTAKKDRNENKTLILKNIEDLKDDITAVNASVQQQIAVIDVEIRNLSARVEKHNNVIERTYKLEQAVADLKGGLR